ncbi:hypothetical protein N0V87_002504 [Didymella glomerata]|uniref:Uncharacterized protein n=1 Tax=Didymella glomerata TaxID=749621 RepID=A0A9W8X4M6_9PLEO|nr:hypothetical protein N0V87_002504 [Didymella glomerata]
MRHLLLAPLLRILKIDLQDPKALIIPTATSPRPLALLAVLLLKIAQIQDIKPEDKIRAERLRLPSTTFPGALQDMWIPQHPIIVLGPTMRVVKDTVRLLHVVDRVAPHSLFASAPSGLLVRMRLEQRVSVRAP